MRQVTIGQLDTCITSRVTHVNDLKLISRVREVLIHTSKMALGVAYATCTMPGIALLYNVTPVDSSVHGVDHECVAEYPCHRYYTTT